MMPFRLQIHSISQHSDPDVVRREFDTLAAAIMFGLPLEGVVAGSIRSASVDSIEKVHGDGWMIVMTVRTDKFGHAASVGAVAARIYGVDALAVTVGPRSSSNTVG